MTFQKGNKHSRPYAVQGVKFSTAAKEVQRAAKEFTESDKRRSDDLHGYMKVTKARG